MAKGNSKEFSMSYSHSSVAVWGYLLTKQRRSVLGYQRKRSEVICLDCAAAIAHSSALKFCARCKMKRILTVSSAIFVVF